ncbi:pachytene checkpoint protein 2 homolog [Pocillopora damicornis]|uniref:pachytene checkpoint protein 2 homolog n=1 Tax=Pocillopora damicornis TaxID=46731 RepID=UPI000F54F34E|nr:pachytene checkpoint protein 2 homolog [Pocillopora damicornis]
MEQVHDLSEALPLQAPLIYHAEVLQDPCSTARSAVIKEHVRKFLMCEATVYGDTTFTEFTDGFLTEHVKSVSVCDTDLVSKERQSNLKNCKLAIHVFQLHDDGPATEELEEDIAAANHWLLPSDDFHGIWESLIFDSDVKAQLINYAMTTLLFSDRGVNSNIISWNRVILLHGPPGTGKTSLCKALAQKLSIRLSDRYSYGQLIEINSHSLFSKWFSESGKLVMKMFQKIQELIDDKDALVCVLIDEVESLTAARKSAMQGQEPSDAIRVVNALLTQIDHIKRYPNVIILTTSNVTGAIDLAFVDRADIKQYIGPPSVNAIFSIYHSCIAELMRAGIISPVQQILGIRDLEVLRFVHNDATNLSLELLEIARKSHGLSGRTLRKIPFLAHAGHVQTPAVALAAFLSALSWTVDKQFEDRENLKNDD